MRSALEAASSLESKGFEGACCSPLLCFLLFPLFLMLFLCLFLSMAKPPVSLPSFSHFAKVSSHFLQHVVCSFAESSKKSKEQEEEAPPQEANTSPLPFLHFLALSFFLGSFPSFEFFCLILQVLT